MNRKPQLVATVVALLLVLLTVGIMTLESGTLTVGLGQSVVGGGGGHLETQDYVLDATIGQPVTGLDFTAQYERCTGFWCRISPDYRVNLPLVIRDA
jgi:hypothetical protein